MRQVSIAKARARLPELAEAASRGDSTVILKHGKPIAAIVPPEQARSRPLSLLDIAGIGRGWYGKDSRRYLRELREEWQR
jgi:prevent-host-death family protein